ncbi:hypothetical protein HDU84_002737 [Entophlyctis sp. JEL0112]|nr:hypothetical protein HDU84_002737 [Entophlyctis sp. JEL0112]
MHPLPPPETLRLILRYLPVEPTLLRRCAHVCRAFASAILADPVFARCHFLFQLRSFLLRSGCTHSRQPARPNAACSCIWEFVDSAGIVLDDFRTLPFHYQVAVYGELLMADRWPHTDAMLDRAKDLFNNRRWKLDSQEVALHLIQTLHHASYFDIACNANRPFRWSCWLGYNDAAKYLLENEPRVDPSDDNNHAIQITASAGHTDLVSFLLSDNRVDPSVDDNKALLLAGMNGHTQVVEILLRHPLVRPPDDCMIVAAHVGRTDVFSLLLKDSRCDPSLGNWEALRLAAEFGHADIVDMILQYSPAVTATPNASDLTTPPHHTNGAVDVRAVNTALRLASANGHAAVVRLLVADARIHCLDERSDLPLAPAIARGHTDVVALLLPLQLATNPGTFSIMSLFCDACGRGMVDIVKIFLRVWQPEMRYVAIGIKRASTNNRLDVVHALLEYFDAEGRDNGAQRNTDDT